MFNVRHPPPIFNNCRKKLHVFQSLNSPPKTIPGISPPRLGSGHFVSWNPGAGGALYLLEVVWRLEFIVSFFSYRDFIYLSLPLHYCFELKENARKVKIHYPSLWRMKSSLYWRFVDRMNRMPIWL